MANTRLHMSCEATVLRLAAMKCARFGSSNTKQGRKLVSYLGHDQGHRIHRKLKTYFVTPFSTGRSCRMQTRLARPGLCHVGYAQNQHRPGTSTQTRPAHCLVTSDRQAATQDFQTLRCQVISKEYVHSCIKCQCSCNQKWLCYPLHPACIIYLSLQGGHGSHMQLTVVSLEAAHVPSGTAMATAS